MQAITDTDTHMNPITIIGSGLAGVTLARELRKLDQTTTLRIVTLDDGHFYSKPALSNALARGKQAGQLVVTPREALAQELNADILFRTQAQAIRADAHCLVTDRGEFAYSRLVLASGARPLRLPIAGDGADDVLSVNSLDDYSAFRKRLEGCRRVALIGAGLIGCEFANDLRLASFEVIIFDIAAQPLGRLLPPAAGNWMKDRLAAAGVDFRLGRGVSRIDRHGGRYLVHDDQGGSTQADLVLSVVGLAPATELAASARLRTERGIVVDRYLETSAADIFALGDGVEIEGLNLPYVAPIQHQAKALAATLGGQRTALAYPPMPVVVKTPACPTVVCPPRPDAQGQWLEDIGTDGVRAVFADAAGNTLGFALLGACVAQRAGLLAQTPSPLAAA